MTSPVREEGTLLLTSLVALGMLAMILGTAIPVVGVALRQDLEDETRTEIAALRVGVERYYADCDEFPPSLQYLLQPPPWDVNWRGPYVNDAFVNQVGTTDSVTHDPWQRAYDYDCPTYWTVRIRSVGPNGVDDGGEVDDIEEHFPIHTAAWDLTNKELLVVQAALDAYNAQEDPPHLPNKWKDIVPQLQLHGFLPPGNAAKQKYKRDAWGRLFKNNTCPVTQVWSRGPP